MIPEVNYVSARLHRDSVCPMDCETSVIIISRRRRKRERRREREKEGETWKKRLMKRRERRVVGAQASQRYLIHVKVLLYWVLPYKRE